MQIKFNGYIKRVKEKKNKDYHKIKVQLTDGTVFETRSTYEEGDLLKLDIDQLLTQLGQVKLQKFDSDGQVAKFQKNSRI